MALVARFEDLVAWQKARELAVRAYRQTEVGKLRSDFSIAGQIRRAALSIPSNIAEGFDRGSKAEFHRYLSIARASSAELRSHLIIAGDLGLIKPDDAKVLYDMAQECSRLVGALRASVARQQMAARKKHRHP